MDKESVIEELSKFAKPKVEKLVIGYPWSSPFIWTRFTDTALNLQRPENSRWVRGIGWCPARRHTDICEKAIELGASHILILGSDQTYEEDMIPRLIKRIEKDGCEAIAAMVPTRGYVSRMNMKPFQPMGWRLRTDGVEEVGRLEDNPQQWEPIDPDAGDVQRVDVIGSGVLLFHRDHLLALRKPWWYYRVDPETMQRVADMDTRMVWRLRSEAGAIVYVDTTIKVKHLHTFEIDDSFQDRFMDWMDPTLTTDDIAQYHERKE